MLLYTPSSDVLDTLSMKNRRQNNGYVQKRNQFPESFTDSRVEGSKAICQAESDASIKNAISVEKRIEKAQEKKHHAL